LVSAHFAIFIDDYLISILIEVLLVRGLAYHFEAVLVVGDQLSILLPDFIASVVISFTINYPESVFIVGNVLSIDHDHFEAILVVLSVSSVLAYLHPISVLIVFEWIVVGIVFDEVSMMVVQFFLPFAFDLSRRLFAELTLLYDVFL
jgi:hypothetical protein